MTNNDWANFTPEQYELVKTAGANERCLFYGTELIRLPNAQMLAMFKCAFNAAYKAALKMLGIESSDQIESFDMDDMEVGQMFVRVTVMDTQGRTASAIGMLPDPRVAH